MSRQGQESVIPVFSKDPEKKKDDKDGADDPTKNNSSATGAGADGKDGKAKEDANGKEKDKNEISQEDLQLKNELEMLIERLQESNQQLHRPALEALRTLIRTSTTSMTSVPKPLKFLRPHYPSLKRVYLSWKKDSADRSLLAQILSVLAMTYSDNGRRETLRFCLKARKVGLGENPEDPGLWGHEYMRHLASELGEEYNALQLAEVEDDEEIAAQASSSAAAAKAATTTAADATVDATSSATGDANGSAKPNGTAATDSLAPKISSSAAILTPEEEAELAGEPITTEQLIDLALLIVPFSLSHNAEADAVDLLLELESIDRLPPFVDKNTYARVCLYMVSCVSLLPPPDDVLFVRTAHEIYRKHDRYPEALALALRLNDIELIRADFEAPQSPAMRKQLAFMLARQQIPIEWLQDDEHPIEDQELVDAVSNTHLSSRFLYFGKELSVSEPKSLEDIYKTHLENTRSGTTGAGVDSARGNLASTFVNAFVNAGFGNDKLMVGAEEGQSWIYKNKGEGMLSAAASLGMSLLWDVDTGLGHIDKYTYSADENIKAGALLAYGILHCGVRSEVDTAIALLSEPLEGDSLSSKISAIVGLGMAYSGSCREDVSGLLLPLVADESQPIQVSSLAALSLGLVFVGSANEEIGPTILQTIMEREGSTLHEGEGAKWSRFLVLGLALLYLGRQDESDAAIELLKAIEGPLAKAAGVLVDMCAYAGTGNVLKIQSMLHLATDRNNKKSGSGEDEEGGEGAGDSENEENEANKDKEEGDEKLSDLTQSLAVLGVALVAMGEDVGAEMSLRHMSHLMHYGEPAQRRAVPLALALLNPSNPSMPILDTLSKYSHDSDLTVALNAILAMGLVGAGSNNARLAQMLRQLAVYYAKEPDCLFMVRVAQGLIHMGKGTIGINPYHTDRQLMSRTAVAGILSVLLSFTDAKSFVLDKSHWMLYYLTTAMYPRFLITLDESLEPLPVSVRVGKAVDVVGQAGKPKTISGFQTHTSPVRLGTYDRAELATEEYLSYAPVLEGFVLLRTNPGYEKP
ncbi:proteasome regulatory particle base subunit [Tilletia horrida]|uniref:26S proteasome regulatory subunit RPN1 n=1 Tax=Tilletia horrida TaxID=155126 RepID=A0AAN6JTJ7_9BASI|nr:proteasome regulatory particle base subunit [Tilletia horrida]KAK0556095.1 proteasome regulatory particle base subunit [Tilletia horrida]KAK0568776.1 proteasome regulatory particle base subunit [Tilletia horrida]